MGKKKPKTDVVRYWMSIHFGICTGPVEYLSRILVEEKPVWPYLAPTKITEPSSYWTFMPDLFGGLEKEGGVAGNTTWLPGRADQVMPEILAAKFGRTSATMPAYRGIATIFFHNSDMPGFYWRANTPYLPGVWTEVGRASTPLGETNARIWRTDLKRISVHIAIDNSAAMAGDGTRGDTLKAAVNEVLDLLSEDISNGRDIDIQIMTYGLASGIYGFPHATTANIATLKSLVNGLTFAALDTNFDWLADIAHNWFNFTAADHTITRRVNIVVAAAAPTEWIVGTDPGTIAARSRTVLSDELTRDGGTFNSAAGTAVDCYGINVDFTDTTYTAYLVNTGGVPVVPGDDPADLTNAILAALYPVARLFDSNPAHIIYECLVNPAWGMGASTAAVDTANFTDCAATLYAERFGLSMIWTRSGAIEDFVSEVLDHIEATLFVNPRTGLLTLKLIRFDYDVDTLPVFTPDNSIVTNFSRKLFGETINEIVVTWTNPENEEEETVVAQDLANIEAQGGVISDGRNYYGVRNGPLAMRLAQRDLRSASTPLAKCDMEVNRIAWDLLPGDVCKLVSPEDDIEQLVMRVGPVDYGKPGDSTVRVSLLEDVFSLALADYTDPPESLWIDTSEPPTQADYSEIITLPYYVVANGIDAGTLAGVDYPEVFAGVLAAELGRDTDTFQLYGQVTNAAGVTSYSNFGTKRISSRATLAADLAIEVETVILSFPDRTQGNGPIVGGLMIIQGADESVSEICLVSDFGTGGYTFVRGVLDTVPRAWPAGTPAWFVDDSMDFIDDVDIRADGETVNYKILPSTSQGTLPESSAPVVSEVMTARPHLPLRPADVLVNGDNGFTGTVDLTGIDPIPVTWARRNRTTETAIIKAWDDGDVTPETGQTTTITLTDSDGVVLHTYSGIAGTSSNVDPADFGGEPSGYIVVSSERDGLSSLQAWRVHVLVTADVLLTLDADDLTLDAEPLFLG